MLLGTNSLCSVHVSPTILFFYGRRIKLGKRPPRLNDWIEGDDEWDTYEESAVKKMERMAREIWQKRTAGNPAFQTQLE